MKYKFTEVLNDLVNYFLLGDIQLLEEWKKGNNLSDNLAMEFTTTESAEAAIPLRLPTKKLMLFTWRILEQFTANKVDDLIRDYLLRRKPIIELENGWYSIEVLGGETLQDGEYEPTLEFLVHRTDGQEAKKVNINESFKIQSSAY